MHQIAVLVGCEVIGPPLRSCRQIGRPLQGRYTDVVPLRVLEV
jgi:hypothetical protein